MASENNNNGGVEMVICCICSDSVSPEKEAHRCSGSSQIHYMCSECFRAYLTTALEAGGTFENFAHCDGDPGASTVICPPGSLPCPKFTENECDCASIPISSLSRVLSSNVELANLHDLAVKRVNCRDTAVSETETTKLRTRRKDKGSDDDEDNNHGGPISSSSPAVGVTALSTQRSTKRLETKPDVNVSDTSSCDDDFLEDLNEEDFYDLEECSDPMEEQRWRDIHCERNNSTASKVFEDEGEDAAKMDSHKEKAEKGWVESGLATELEPALRSGAIALLDAHWLIKYALCNKEEREQPVILPYRQQLPCEAFLSLEQIVWSTRFDKSSTGAGITVLSYMWLHPSHPDPKGSTLELVAKKCLQLFSFDDSCRRFAIFWDYASLFQHPDPSNGVYRTAAEEALFQEGLDHLSRFFSNPSTYCLRITKFPKGYPRQYNLPPDANCAKYDHRGWPIVESGLASMTKDPNHMCDLCVPKRTNGDFVGNYRPGPLTPERMWEKLCKASFTNARVDRPRVMLLYKTQFLSAFSQVRELKCHFFKWTDKEVALLAEVIRMGYVPLLQSIDLTYNLFGDKGCEALAHALCGPHALPGLDRFALGATTFLFWNCKQDGSPISDAGALHLVPVFINTISVALYETQVSFVFCEALAEATRNKGDDVKLRSLSLAHSSGVGDRGVQSIIELICTQLVMAHFTDCNIGDDSCRALADGAVAAVGRGNGFRCPLKELHLGGKRMQITHLSCQHLCRFTEQCPELELLVVPEVLEQTSFREHLESHALHPKFKVEFS